MERSLTSVFEKHLGFPGAGRARVTAEAFVDRVVDRLHHFDEASDDLVRWVEHFFDTEHLAEDRCVEFSAFAEGREHPVLEMSLGEQEFVVVDSDRDDEIVVVSGAGSMVVQRTTELVSRLRAAELPAPQQHRLGDAFRPSGERVYLVNGQGSVTALDAKAVMTALRAAPMRSEPVARVTDAATRLPIVSPAPPSSITARAAVTSATPRTYAVREVKALARRDLSGTSAGTVRVLDRSGDVRTLSGGAARVWQSLTSNATDHGRRPEGTVAGVTAVAVGQQTFAVKAGGVTALVQRPARAEPSPATMDSGSVRSRADRVMPAWLRELLSGAVRGHYWVDPSASTSTRTGASAGGWVTMAMEQARAARVRARVELSGELDPAPVQVRAVRAMTPASVIAGGAVIDASVVVGAAATGASSNVTAGSTRPAASYRLTEEGITEPLPLGRAAALPATTLRALFTAMERSAAYEGRQLRAAVVSVAPPLESPSTQSSEVGVHSVSKLELDTVPRHAAALPVERTSVAAVPGLSPEVRSLAGQPRALFSLPFEESGTLRIGRELDVVMARAFDGVAMAPMMVPATLTTLVKVSGTPERVRIEVPELRRARPRVETAPGVMGSGAVDLSSLGELQWSTYAARSSASRAGAAVRTPMGRPAATFEHDAMAAEREPAAWTDGASSPEMDFAAPRAARPAFFGGAGATALGAMAPASGGFGAPDLFGWSSTSDGGTGTAGGTAQPLYVEPALATAALPLAEVNFRRTPLDVAGAETSEPVFAQDAGAGDDDPGTLSFDIPLPLHAQMSGKTLPVFARSRASGPIGHAHSTTPFPSLATSPAASSTSAQPARPGLAAPPSTPVAKAMPLLRRSPREASFAGTSQVLVDRPVTGSDAPSATSAMSSPRATPSVRHPSAPGLAGSAAAPRTAAPNVSAGLAPQAGFAPQADVASPSVASPSVSSSSAAPAHAPRRSGSSDTDFDGATADRVPTGPSGARVRPSGIGARAYTDEPFAHFGTPSMAHPAFEATHVVQQSGAPARPRRRGATPLRFRYPTSARWWGESSKTTGKASYAGRLAASGAVVAAPAVAADGPSAGVESPSPARGRRSPSTRLPRAATSSVVASGAAASDATFVENSSYGGDYPPVGDRETAYVVLDPDGHAQVMNARAASQVSRAKAHGAPVDMAVVAAVPPTAPTLEQMAVPGHDRPHAKAKKEQPRTGAAAKTDATSLQGTVDSLAQRIYHRLRRRLEADRERFGG